MKALESIWKAIGWIGNVLLQGLGFQIAAETGGIAAKIARIVIYISVVAGLFTALYMGMQTTMSSLAVSLPPSVIVFAGAIIPTNTPVCIAAIMGAYFARFIFDMHKQVAHMLAS